MERELTDAEAEGRILDAALTALNAAAEELLAVPYAEMSAGQAQDTLVELYRLQARLRTAIKQAVAALDERDPSMSPE